jgi:hypothetical protein
MRLKIVLVVFIVLLPICLAYSQETLFEKGTVELYLAGGSGWAKQAFLYGGEIGVALDGFVGLSFAYGKVEQQAPYQDEVQSFSPILTVALRGPKQKSHSFIGIRAGLASVKTKYYGARQAQAFSFGFFSMASSKINPKITFAASAGMDFLIPLENSNNSNSIASAVTAAAGFRFALTPHLNFFIIPGASIAQDVKAFVISAGIGAQGVFSPTRKPLKQ